MAVVEATPSSLEGGDDAPVARIAGTNILVWWKRAPRAAHPRCGDEASPPPHCFSRKNKFPVGGVMVMLFVPLLVVMV